MQHRNDYQQTHPPSDDKSKVAILWDERHDCKDSLAEVFARLRGLEDKMTVSETLRASGARLTVWVSSLCTGVIIAVLNYILDNWK